VTDLAKLSSFGYKG